MLGALTGYPAGPSSQEYPGTGSYGPEERVVDKWAVLPASAVSGIAVPGFQNAQIGLSLRVRAVHRHVVVLV